MSSWFDDMDKASSQTEDVVDERDERNDLARAEKRAGSSSQRTVAGTTRTAVWLLPVLGVVLVALFLSVWTLSTRGSAQGSEPSAAPAEESAEESAPVDPATQVAVAGQCEPEEGETTLSTSDTSLRATVAQWQEAYYSRDETLTELLSADSWMREQDWSAILPEAAPDGVSWCAVMAPVEQDRVDVDVIATFPDGSSQTYQQTVVGKQESGRWLIDDIETR